MHGAIKFKEIIENLKGSGVSQASGFFWQNNEGRRISTSDTDRLHEVISVSIIGALKYALARKWITVGEYYRLFDELQCAASQHGFRDITSANDAGISFETMAKWLN
jgi:hypothetical protein